MRSERAVKFEDLIMWQKAHALVLRVYDLTKGFPREEKYGLTSQLRRAVVSVPTNMAEGFLLRASSLRSGSGASKDKSFRSLHQGAEKDRPA